jgi:type IV secretion system protein VirB10
LTNRNEQQKQIQRLALETVTSPVETKKQKGSNYPVTKPQGYNTGYNSGYTGTNTQITGSGYMPQSLSNNLDKFLAQQTGGNLASSYVQQNNQSAKQEFLNRNGIGGNFQWNAEYSLWKGTVISAVLDTGIITDLPGQIMAHVSKNVYSSQDGRYLLIPQGSRLFGEYSSDISYGQNRVQVVWNTLIRPDGLEVNLGSMNGIDSYGASGYAGWKTEHPFEYLKAFGLIAMYSVLDTKAMNLIDTQNNAYAQNALSDVYSETKKLNNKIVDRALDIQPTIRIKSGTEVNLITNVTIDLPPLEPYEAEEKYVRY